MTYHGRNFDVLVANTATVVLVVKKRVPITPKKLGILFSFFGLGLYVQYKRCLSNEGGMSIHQELLTLGSKLHGIYFKASHKT